MAGQVKPGLLDRFVAPRPLFLGVVVAFVACCVLGRVLAGRNCYKSFARFHRLINTESQYFPTPSQVHALGLATLEPDRIAVVVGGNSVLMGTGQREHKLWSRQLQQHLGDRYRVLNLATPSAQPWEFGGLAAESLLRDRPNLIFVSCLRLRSLVDRPDGDAYQRFFWDARGKGMVPHDDYREEKLRRVLAHQKDDFAFQDMRLRQAIDGTTHSNDLWTTASYRWVNTVWSQHLTPNFLTARRHYPDPPPRIAPVSARFPAATNAEEMKGLRRHAAGCKPAAAVSACAKNFPEPMHPRTLLLVVRDCPHYVDQLPPDLRARYDDYFPAVVDGLRDNGFASREVGREYSAADYHDRLHLGESGGAKLAVEVAEEVRTLAERLGYLQREGD